MIINTRMEDFQIVAHILKLLNDVTFQLDITQRWRLSSSLSTHYVGHPVWPLFYPTQLIQPKIFYILLTPSRFPKESAPSLSNMGTFRNWLLPLYDPDKLV